MPKGQHSSIRVALAIPPKLHEQIKAWADYEGRPVASLCMYLIENSLRQAQREGIAPDWKTELVGEVPKIDKWVGADGSKRSEPQFKGVRFESAAEPEEERKRFTQFYEDKLAEQKLQGKIEDKPQTKEDKQAKLLALLAELTASED